MSLNKNTIEINDVFDLVQSLGLDREMGKELMELCRQNDITSLGLFGSFSRGEQNDESDIDLLVTFSKGKSLIDHIKIENEFGTLLGKKVDLVTERSLSPYISPMVKDELRRIYCEG
ncbi:nucleotidyltransferase family protein [Methanolobus sp.]|uniref:nucleotidyltransferase family protein n=1 Tax=Methanolobus sp. TaxID=1874737 RepID=UPI00258FCF33|nr:nucleotidyltransferase family protein [Methanolobus sp.]